MKKHYLTFLLSFYMALSYGQQKDSITSWLTEAENATPLEKKRLLNKAYRNVSNILNDTIKASYLVSLSHLYAETDDTLSFRKVSKEAIELNTRLNDFSNLANAYWHLGNYFSERTYQSDSAYYYYHKAQQLYEKIGDNFSSAQILLNMAINQTDSKDYTGSEITTIKAIMLLKPLKKYSQLYSCYNNLGIISNELREYDKALKYHEQALKYLRKTKERNILEPITLNNIGMVYKNQKKYKKAIEKYKEAKRYDNLYINNLEWKATLIDNIAYAQFKLGETNQLPDVFYESLKIRDSLNSISGIVVNKLHLAEYYTAYKDTLKALKYAGEARELAASSNNFRDLLASLKLFSKLVKCEKSVAYLNRYIELNDSLQKEERRIRNKFTRIRFETDELIVENKKAMKQLQTTSKLSFFIILFFSAFTYYYYIRQRMYRVKFKALLAENGTGNKKQVTGVKAYTLEDLDISEKALNNITEKLKVFIREQQFLDNDLSLYNLAKAMETNPAYLSKVINFYQQKNFSTYITELRINYAVKALKTNAIFRKYTIKAIAKEVGFNNEQSFSRAFYKKTGIYPSYFIKNLEKEVLRNSM